MAAVPRPTPRFVLPVEITPVMLAELSGLTRRQVHRRLRAENVPLHVRGEGTQRRHVYTTYAELQATCPWWVEQLEHWGALLARRQRGGEADDDDG